MATDEELKRALKAFKKRLKLARLDDESGLSRGSKTSRIESISPPTGHPPARRFVSSPDDPTPPGDRPTVVRHLVIHSKQLQEVVLPAPGPRFRVEVTIDPTFVPQLLSPDVIDNRNLGALVDYEFLPPRKAAHKKLKR